MSSPDRTPPSPLLDEVSPCVTPRPASPSYAEVLSSPRTPSPVRTRAMTQKKEGRPAKVTAASAPLAKQPASAPVTARVKEIAQALAEYDLPDRDINGPNALVRAADPLTPTPAQKSRPAPISVRTERPQPPVAASARRARKPTAGSAVRTAPPKAPAPVSITAAAAPPPVLAPPSSMTKDTQPIPPAAGSDTSRPPPPAVAGRQGSSVRGHDSPSPAGPAGARGEELADDGTLEFSAAGTLDRSGATAQGNVNFPASESARAHKRQRVDEPPSPQLKAAPIRF
ncbi:hypothetical protein VTO73DRAFT_2351 [Trametes versicolor]